MVAEPEVIDSAVISGAFRNRMYISNIGRAVFDDIQSQMLNDVCDKSLGRKAVVQKLNTITQGENSTRIGKLFDYYKTTFDQKTTSLFKNF